MPPALTAAARAQRLARDSGGAVSPALRLAAQPLPLTEREREIISLVSQGLSNRQIAETRTGIRSRAQLATLLTEAAS